MKSIVVTSLVALAALTGLVATSAAEESVPSWPPGKMDVFVSAQTWTAPSAAYTPPAIDKLENFFPRGSAVHFFVTAVDMKTRLVLTGKDVKYANLFIPGQPKLSLAWEKHGTKANAPSAFQGTWTIPADYTLGVVPFRIVIKTKAKRYGSFEQVPVAAAQLTVIDKA